MSDAADDGLLSVAELTRECGQLGLEGRVRVVDCRSAQTLRVVALAVADDGVLEIVVRV